MNWYECRKCFAIFSSEDSFIIQCPICKSIQYIMRLIDEDQLKKRKEEENN